ncbi:ATP-dependent Clp protease adaptor ClpS [Roseateles sp. NT4]|uniref:ATP-dependent Clp protease adaptor ClpS n=1 Tax=Roseateles sp. NT4 TaxID=3453715 RepID=UPI003EEDA298
MASSASGAIAGDVTASLHDCFSEARKRRYETVSLEQLLLALLGSPRVVEVLLACSVDLARLREGLEAILQHGTPLVAGSAPVQPRPSFELEHALQRAILRVQATRGRPVASTGPLQAARRALARWMPLPSRAAVDGADLLVAVFSEKESPAVRELQRHGTTHFDVTRYLAHGIRKSDPAEPLMVEGPAHKDVDVVLFNDDFTPMEFVVKLLQDHFMFDLGSAEQVMLKIHREGRAVCGCFAADVAASKVELVRAAAHQEEHPLRCTVEPV